MASARSEERRFKASIAITKAEDDSPVFFKVDGERFEDSRTLKLTINTNYKLAFEFQPPLELCYAAFGVDSNLEPELKKKDNLVSSYACTWSTVGFEVSKSKARQHFQLSLRFQDQGQLTYQTQVKMYGPKDKNHVMWGTCLKSIDLDCKMRDGSSFVDIQKVNFR